MSETAALTFPEVEAIWNEYFASPFPKSSAPFWCKYPAPVIRYAFEAMRRKSKNYKFESLADACRFASGVMRAYVVEYEAPAPQFREKADAQAGV